jgi:hypothetical protein
MTMAQELGHALSGRDRSSSSFTLPNTRSPARGNALWEDSSTNHMRVVSKVASNRLKE